MMHVWLSRAIFLRREQEKILESAKALGRPSDRARKEAAAVRVRPDLTAAGRVAPTPITAERRRDGRTDGRTQSRLYVNYCNFATRTLALGLTHSLSLPRASTAPPFLLLFPLGGFHGGCLRSWGEAVARKQTMQGRLREFYSINQLSNMDKGERVKKF